MLNIIQHPQEERDSGSENIPTDTMNKPETHPSTISVIIKKKQSEWKSICLVRDAEASLKGEQESESEEAACCVAE